MKCLILLMHGATAKFMSSICFDLTALSTITCCPLKSNILFCFILRSYSGLAAFREIQVGLDVTLLLPVDTTRNFRQKRRSRLNTNYLQGGTELVTCYKYFFCFYYDQQLHNYFTNYHNPPTCFDTIVSSSVSSQLVPCQVTQVYQIQLFVIRTI